MTRTARVAAQGKINVWLHVGGPDGAGYHEIRTLFQRVDLSDDVLVRALDRPGKSVSWEARTVRGVSMGPPERNLAYRAAEAFTARARWPRGFEIELTKQIPVGGGLGGGSADAGAVLRALNALCPFPLDAAGLREVAASIGSDVPFLTSEHVRAVGMGRGERLVPFAGELPAAPLLLVMPAFGVSTADAYRWIDETGPRSLDVSVLPAGVAAASAWKDLDFGNDFEAVVEPRYPVLREIRESLAAAGAAIARLSGSGSTVLGIFPGGLPDVPRLSQPVVVVPTSTSASVVQVETLE